MVATCIVALLTSDNTPNSGDETTHDQINSPSTTEKDETMSPDETEDIPIPPVVEDSSETTTEKPSLDVSDMGNDPNPSVVDSKIEYGTKEVETENE